MDLKDTQSNTQNAKLNVNNVKISFPIPPQKNKKCKSLFDKVEIFALSLKIKTLAALYPPPYLLLKTSMGGGGVGYNADNVLFLLDSTQILLEIIIENMIYLIRVPYQNLCHLFLVSSIIINLKFILISISI